ANTVEVKVPDIGGYDDVPVIEVLVAVGEAEGREEGQGTLGSDKASMEVPSSHAGVVKELKVKLGDTASEGSVVVVLETEAAADAPAAPVAAAGGAGADKTAAAAPPAQAASTGDEAGNDAGRADGGAGALVEATVPDIGGYDDVPVIEVLVAVGDTVARDQGLVTLESDKATM